MVTPLAYFDLIEAFPKPGCAICALLLRDVDHFLDSLLYERVNEFDTLQAFRARRGLCNPHSWQLAHYKGNVVGIAVLQEATLDGLLRLIDDSSGERSVQTRLARLQGWNAGSRESKLADRLEPTGPCIACRLLTDSETTYVKVFSRYLADPSMQTAYGASHGLCLPHFRQALRRVRRSDHLRQLISTQTAIWKRLQAELRTFIDKNTAQRMHEAMGAEGDSWQRAIVQTAGDQEVFGVDERTD